MESYKSTDELTSNKSKQGVTGKLAVSIFTASLGMLQFGYNSTVVSAPQALVEQFINETYTDRNGDTLQASTITFLWSLVVSMFAIGGMAGAAIGAWWADKFGRVGGMVLNSLLGVSAGLIMGLSKVASSYELLIIGRVLVGFNCGLYTGLSPIYNAEISPNTIRGAVGTLNQLAVTIGLLLGQVFGLTKVFGTEDLWALLFGITVIFPGLQFLLLWLCPESPRYLLLTLGKEKDAAEALKQLRATDDVTEEIEAMLQEQKSGNEGEETMSMVQVIKAKHLRLPLIISIIMHLSQQFSGINCIFYYAVTLFQNVGLSEDEAKYANLGVGVIMIVMTLVSIPLMDRLGRKTLHLTGLTGMMIISIVFTICFSFAVKNNELWLQYLSITSALSIVIFFAVGPGSIPWMIVAELFSQGPRAAAVNIGALVNWFSNFVVGLTFPLLLGGLNELVFLPFTLLLLFFVIWLGKYLPETKGKTIEEITSIFVKDKVTLSSTEVTQKTEKPYIKSDNNSTYL